MSYVHPGKQRSLETYLERFIQKRILFVVGPPKCGKRTTILKYIPHRGRHREFTDSINDSQAAFTDFILQNLASRTLLISNIPYFAHNNIPLLLDTIHGLWSKIPQTQLIILKIAMEGEATDILWKFQKHQLYNYRQLDQISFNKIAKTYLTRFVRDTLSTRKSTRPDPKLIDQCDGQFNKANLLHRVYGNKNDQNQPLHSQNLNSKSLSHFHALGKVLYNKTLVDQKTPENSAHSIVLRQPASFTHFNAQLVKNAPEFNKNSDFESYGRLLDSVCGLELPIAAINRDVLEMSKSVALVSGLQEFSAKNVSGNTAAFRKMDSVDPEAKEKTMLNEVDQSRPTSKIPDTKRSHSPKKCPPKTASKQLFCCAKPEIYHSGMSAPHRV